MSWKTDKFQALRDRAMNTKAGCAQIEAAMARSAQIQAVTASLRPEPASRYGDFMDAVMYGALSGRAGKAWGASLAQAAMRPSYFNKFAGTQAKALIADDLAGALTLDKIERAKAQLTANEVNARTRSTELHIQGVMAKLRAEAEEAKALAEIMRGEPEPDPWDRVLDMATMADKGMRYAYGLNVTRPSPVVAISGV